MSPPPPGESQLRQSRATQPTVHAWCFSVPKIHRTLTWTTGSLMCTQMYIHAIAHGGCTDIVRESELNVDSRRKITCRTGESHLRRRRAGPMLFQLSRIPIPVSVSNELCWQCWTPDVLSVFPMTRSSCASTKRLDRAIVNHFQTYSSLLSSLPLLSLLYKHTMCCLKQVKLSRVKFSTCYVCAQAKSLS